jgi:hypothetical protein
MDGTLNELAELYDLLFQDMLSVRRMISICKDADHLRKLRKKERLLHNYCYEIEVMQEELEAIDDIR